MYIGRARSLFELCVMYLANHMRKFGSKLSLLPRYLQEVVQRRHEKLSKINQQFMYKCTIKLKMLDSHIIKFCKHFILDLFHFFCFPYMLNNYYSDLFEMVARI